MGFTFQCSAKDLEKRQENTSKAIDGLEQRLAAAEAAAAEVRENALLLSLSNSLYLS